MKPNTRSTSIAIFLSALALGCISFSLAEQVGTLPVPKHRRAANATLVVLPFSVGPGVEQTDSDLATWQRMLAAGLDQSNIFESVVVQSPDGPPGSGDYSLGGRVHRCTFQKNWVPTFFPLHLGLSFFTFTAYTLFGGPMTATRVRFEVDFDLTVVESGQRVTTFRENYRSTRAVNVYSKGSANPYDNPNLVFAEIIDHAATKIAAALP